MQLLRIISLLLTIIAVITSCIWVWNRPLLDRVDSELSLAHTERIGSKIRLVEQLYVDKHYQEAADAARIEHKARRVALGSGDGRRQAHAAREHACHGDQLEVYRAVRPDVPPLLHEDVQACGPIDDPPRGFKCGPVDRGGALPRTRREK